MAIPALMIPIIMAVASMASGAVEGYSNAKNAQEEAKATQKQTKDQINTRAREARKLMNEQKTSFLKSGIYFNTGTAADVIDETYNVMQEDIKAMETDSETRVKNLVRQGRTAFFSSLLGSASSGVNSFFQSGGTLNAPNTNNNSGSNKTP